MHGIDIILFLLLLVGAWKGWSSGFFRQLTSVVGFFLGLLIAWMFYDHVAEFLAPYTGTTAELACVLAFVLLWIGVPIVLSVIALLFTKVADCLALGWLNRLSGAALGVIKYALVLSALLNLCVALDFISKETRRASVLCGPLQEGGSVLFHYAQDSCLESHDKLLKQTKRKLDL